jgi:O-antigen ligase
MILFATSFAAIPIVVKHYRAIFVIILLAFAVNVMMDTFSAPAESLATGRAAGVANNPNITALILVVLGIASIDWTRTSSLNAMILLVVGAAVFPTLSRGGYLAYLLMLGFYLTFVMKPQVKTLPKLIMLAVFFASIFTFGRAAIIEPILASSEVFQSSNAQHRLDDLYALRSGDFASVARDRGAVASSGGELITQSPLLGYGTSFNATMPQGTHNLYLVQWVDNGALGLVFLLVFLFASFWHFIKHQDVRGIAFVAVFSLSAFFSHNLLEQGTQLFMFGFLGALAYMESPRLRPGVSLFSSLLPTASVAVVGSVDGGRGTRRTPGDYPEP